MVWNLVFWLAVAYLALAVILRYFVPAFSPALVKRSDPAKKEETDSSTWKLLAVNKIIPVVAVLLMAIAFVARANPDLLKTDWSQEDKEQLASFSEAMDLYSRASEIATYRPLSSSDWESIRALLEASYTEAQNVSGEVLTKIDDEMRKHYQEEFLPGLRKGNFGLSLWTQGIPKGKSELPDNGADSLRIGRELLDTWDAWYLPRQEAIFEIIGPLDGEE